MIWARSEPSSEGAADSRPTVAKLSVNQIVFAKPVSKTRSNALVKSTSWLLRHLLTTAMCYPESRNVAPGP